MSDTETRLRDFVAWVRWRRPIGGADAPIDEETLEVVAQYLEEQKPWEPLPGKGRPANRDLMWRCYWLGAFGKDGNPPLPQHGDEGGAYKVVGEQLNKSPSTIKGHIQNAQDRLKTAEGRGEFMDWLRKNEPRCQGRTLVFEYNPEQSAEERRAIRAEHRRNRRENKTD